MLFFIWIKYFNRSHGFLELRHILCFQDGVWILSIRSTILIFQLYNFSYFLFMCLLETKISELKTSLISFLNLLFMFSPVISVSWILLMYYLEECHISALSSLTSFSNSGVCFFFFFNSVYKWDHTIFFSVLLISHNIMPFKILSMLLQNVRFIHFLWPNNILLGM